MIRDGALVLTDIWVPRTGIIHLYVDSPQLARFGRVGWVKGLANLHGETRNHIAFTAAQQAGEQETMTYEDVESWATSHEATFSGGASVIIEGGFSGGQTITRETGSTVGQSITVKFPGTGFDMDPHR